MRSILRLTLLTTIILVSSTAAFSQRTTLGTGCLVVGTPPTPTGQRDDTYFYTDCYLSQSGETTDKERLQRAIDGARESTLIFNESDYRINGHLTINYPKTTLEGFAPAEGGVTISKITLTVSSDSIFRIGTGIKGITIKNLGLAASLTSNTYGIEALGTTGSNSSQMFHFSNLWIAGFSKGIYAHTTDSVKGWQFDDVHIEDTVFAGCEYGIYLDTQNTGWQMNNLAFSSGEGQNGIHIEYGGYINMNLMVGNGVVVPNTSTYLAGEFIRIEGHHGPVTMQNINAEGYKVIDREWPR
ncbi:MAG TPA: hypothetical protein VGO50_18790 [Pyrinomonadaceae bacterium]|jgi:hypothetical protein|nr:hypothetical protein [Pyrinomonadaceae bacterium]